MNHPNASADARGIPSAWTGGERTRRWGRPVPSALVAILLVTLGATLAALRDRESVPRGQQYRIASALRPEAVRRVALSFEAVLADLYWIRAVQHYGRTRLAGGRPEDYDLLYPLLDVTTTLDPRFDAAHRLGAALLAEPSPGGPGRPDLAFALLRKGMENAPERWEYLQDMGFVHYWWLHDLEEAARWFERAADVPGAPWWLRPLAAVTRAEGGDRAGARALWGRVRGSTGDAWLRGEATRRLAQLDALDALDGYQHVIDGYFERTGRRPGSWRELLAAGDVAAVPVDPTGVPYELATPGGTVAVSRRSALFPLPDGGSLRKRRAR